ncbi:MAG: hypothetical protein KGQ88_02910, partial [Chloroflexi bacterium]|nr:hypothetical protein [Chloroflexota bacterium]
MPVDAASSARVGAGLSTSTKGILGAQDALALALDPLEGARADVVALFISPQFEDEIPRIVELAGERAEDAVIVGCSAGGVLGGDVEVEDAPAVAAWAASLPSTGVQPFRLTFEHDGDQGVIDGLDELPSADRGAVVVMLSDPFSFPADVFLGHLNDNAPGVPVLGGQASGGLEA